jgi:hypothetical protein
MSVNVVSVPGAQAIAFRLLRQGLGSRLPAGSYVAAARFAIQDTYPRSALLSLHARVESCAGRVGDVPVWADPGLAQTYSPRGAVHVFPAAEFGLFTVARLPGDPAKRQVVLDMAEQACRWLDGQRVRSIGMPTDIGRALRHGAASGRIAIRWDASAVWFWEVPAPELDFDEGRKALCRRHLQGYGPSTPTAFAWWAGLPPADGRAAFRDLAAELLEVDLAGQRAWILAADGPALRSASAPPGARLLPAEERKLFGVDRTGLFVGPKRLVPDPPPFDTYHPHVVLFDGRIVGAWGRRAGRVDIRLAERVDPARIEAEALAFPIPGATMSVEIQQC